MKIKYNLLAILSIFSTKAYSQEINTIPFTSNVDTSKLFRSDINIQLELIDRNNNLQSVLFEKYGIIADEKTFLYFHEENSHIDLSCFNCIVINRNKDANLPGPENEIFAK